MKITLIVLLLAMALKDTSHVNNPYIFRGVGQGLAALVGIWWLAKLGSKRGGMAPYWVLIAYIAWLFLGASMSPHPWFVALQVASVTGVLIFFISFFRVFSNDIVAISKMYRWSSLLLGIIAFLSLALYIVDPSFVNSVIAEYEYSTEIRFHGLYPSPAMMAGAMGLLLGIVIFLDDWKWWKFPVVLVTLTCLYLTQSRTFWVGALIALGITALMYFPSLRKKAWVYVLLLGFVGFIGAMALDFRPDIKDANKIVRVESVSNLSGRTSLWLAAIEKSTQRPIAGYGLTMGALALHRKNGVSFAKSNSGDRDISRETLHNGYIQSILDSGYVGFLLYISVFLVSIIKVVKAGVDRRYAPLLYVLVFFMVSNLGESVIYGASTFSTTIFWGSLVYALSLGSVRKIKSGGAQTYNIQKG